VEDIMNSAQLIWQAIRLLGVMWLSAITAFGQGVTGTAAGKVTDAKNKGIPGALVTIANPKIAAKGKATTQPNGYFAIPQLRPGEYLLSVEKEGYKPFRKQPVFIDAMGRVNASPVRIEGRAGPQGLVTVNGHLQIILVAVDDGTFNEAPRPEALSQLGSFAIRGFNGLVVSRQKSNPTGFGNFPIIVTQNPTPPSTANPQTTPPPQPQTQQPQTPGAVPDAGRQQLQSLSGERSDLVTNNQVKNLALNGRDIIEFLKLMPGIVSDFNGRLSLGDFSGQISSPDGINKFFINGTRGNQHELVIDGVSNIDTSGNASRHVTVNPDAVAEIKVLTANYQAEYGKAAGGFIQIVTKSGTTEYHGGAHFFHRHEGLNANNFFNNAQGRNAQGKEVLPRPLYRYNTFGYDVGGPFALPRFSEGGSAVKKIENLFFFLNQEFYRQLAPNPQRSIRVPTADERIGNFRNSINQQGNPVFLRDPSKTGACTSSNTPANPGACFVHNGQINVIPLIIHCKSRRDGASRAT
jgi:hypothetical protein